MPSSTASSTPRTALPSTARPCANHRKNPPSVASLTPTPPSEPLKPSTGATVRGHRNAVRDRSESLSAINRKPCPQSPESAMHPASPRVSAELPETGERFEGLIPPVVASPAFAIRKPAVAVFTLGDYASVGIMTAEQAEHLRSAIAQRRNVLVAGGTSTGKTTLVNALLAEVANTADRVVLIEDT